MEGGLRLREVWGARLVAVLLALLVASLIPGPLSLQAAAAQGTDGSAPTVQWEATVNGRPVDQIDANEPLRLEPEEGAKLDLTLTNTSGQEVSVRSVRLDGKVMGLTMYNFTTRIDLVLAPGEQTTRTFDLDLIDLSGQATGLIPSRLQLLDNERNVLQEQSFPADIRGSVNSVYGVFGLAVLGITLVLLAGLLLAIRRTEMPRNRWRRAVRFVPVGIGLGLVLTFSLSALRQLSPSAASWTTVVLVCAAGAFALGYFLPVGVPDDQEPDTDLADVDGEDGADDTQELETVGADTGDAAVTSAPATGQSAGHFWTSSSQAGTGTDQSGAAEDDW